MASLHHLLVAGALLTVLHTCLAELYDVTTIYRFDKAYEIGNFSTSVVDLPNITSWDSSGWVETDSVRTFAVLPTEERTILTTNASTGLSDPIPMIWGQPFVVKIPLRSKHSEFYIIFMTSKGIQFGDLLVLHLSDYFSIKSCNFLEGGLPIRSLNGRRCRKIGRERIINSEYSKDFYFHINDEMVTITSPENENENGFVVNIPSTYLLGKSYVSVGTAENYAERFIFSIPKKVLALSKPSGRLETEFSIKSSSALCFEMMYLMQHYPGSKIKLFLESGSRRITLGEVNGKETEAKWSTHRFLSERLQPKHPYRLIIEANNELGMSPIFIHNLQNCVEKGDWNASTYPLPGREEIHANTNALGHQLRLHNGTVISPASKDRKLITPFPDKKFEGTLDNWNFSKKFDEVTLKSKNRHEYTSRWIPQGSEYSSAMEYRYFLNLSFSVPINPGNLNLALYLKPDDTSYNYRIKLDSRSLDIFERDNYYSQYCDFPFYGQVSCHQICSKSRNSYWTAGDIINVYIKATKNNIIVSVTSEEHDTISCTIPAESSEDMSAGSFIIRNVGTQLTNFYLHNKDVYSVELTAQEGSIISQTTLPINNQLCLGLTYYMEPNTALKIYAELDNGKKFEMSTISANEITGWQWRNVRKSYGLFDKPVRYIIQGTRAEGSRLLIQDAFICDWNEDVIEIKQEDKLTVMNYGSDVDNKLDTAVKHGDSCLNGGVLTGTGECACPPGFVGPRCEEGCGPNRYGDDCSGLCSASQEECRAMILCRPHLGCECAPGYTGYFCLQNCSDYWFGAGCRQPCGHCRRGSCDPYTGHCRAGCTPGFYPPLCKEKCSYLLSAPVVEKLSTKAFVTVNLTDSNVLGRGTPYYYQLQYKSAQGEWLPMRSDLIDSNKPTVTVVIDNLPLYEVYWIRAVIINKDGTSYQGDSVPVTEVQPQCMVPAAAEYSLRSDEINTSGFLLTWQVPPTTADWCPVDHYEVFIKKDWRWALYCETTNNSVYVGELTSGWKYAVKVRAVTPTGQIANFSDPLEVRVPGWSLEKVKNLKVDSAETRTLTVSWSYPEPEAEAIQHYVVTYECLELISCPNHPCSNSRGQKQTVDRHVLLTGLVPHAQYSVTVAPYKDTKGPTADFLAITLPSGSQAAPGMAKDFVFDVTNTSFSVRWTMPENCSDLNGFFRGFHYRIRAQGEHEVLADGDTVQLTAAFSDLAPLTHYDVEVFVMTNGGWDEKYPLSIPVRTRATTPDKVTDLTVYKRARRMFGLRWGRPARTYGTLKSFTVTYSVTGKSAKAKTLQVDPTPCPAWPHLYCCTITHIKPDVQYTIRVQARNAEVDEDGDIEEIEAISIEGAPSAPAHIQLLSHSNSSLSIRWGIPDMLNGILRSFLVSVEEVDTYNISDCCQYFPIQELPVRAEENLYQLEVSGLRPASTYTVSVSAKTVALGPPVNISAHTKPPSPRLVSPPIVILEHVNREVIVHVEPVVDMEDLVRRYLLLLIPSLPDKQVPEAVIWDEVFAEELRTSVNRTFYLVAELTQDELTENKVHILRWDHSSEDGVFGQILSPEPFEGVTYRMGLVAILEYQGTRSFAYEESDPFVLSWLGESS